MDTPPVEKRVVFGVKRLLSLLIARLRRAAGSLLQLVVHDQLGEISHQTQRLGSASVESVNYLGGELRDLGGQMRGLDERLSRIEEELARLGARLDRSDQPARENLVEDAGDIPVPPRSG